MFYNSPWADGSSPDGRPRADGSIRDTRKLAVCGVDFSFRARKKRSAELLLKPTLVRSCIGFKGLYINYKYKTKKK